MCSTKVMLSLALFAANAICIVSADIGKPSICCTKVSKAKPSPAIQIDHFYVQKASPPCVEAVMFITNAKRIICSKPNTPWVKKKQEELRKKDEEARSLSSIEWNNINGTSLPHTSHVQN
ncbi:uncharacterized protein LOC143810137 [Ranitomeya variabilis]|uniref:uncharacterized protein LOC143810137 n=1 Tax=Ranitomeya variabilis TaxID=490064 RepID=UPI004056B82A